METRVDSAVSPQKLNNFQVISPPPRISLEALSPASPQCKHLSQNLLFNSSTFSTFQRRTRFWKFIPNRKSENFPFVIFIFYELFSELLAPIPSRSGCCEAIWWTFPPSRHRHCCCWASQNTLCKERKKKKTFQWKGKTSDEQGRHSWALKARGISFILWNEGFEYL